MSLRGLRRFACVAVSAGGSLLMGQRAWAAVSLMSGSAPAALSTGSTSNPVNFTAEGDYAWVYYAGTGGNTPASPAFQKGSAPAAFSSLTGLTATGTTTTVGSSRTGGVASGVTAAVTTTDSASANLTNLPGYTYVSTSNSATGAGMQSTYTMPAGAAQTLSVYCYTLNGVFGRMQVTEDDGSGATTLYDDGAAGVLLPVSAAQPTKGGGVYRFELENDDAVPHVLTFAYTIAAYPAGVTSGQIGFEGMTASTSTAAVPEPAVAAAMGLTGLALVRRRRPRV